jgi:hypothetical protein
MIDLLLALHGLAQHRGDGLLPGLAERLRMTPCFGDGRLVAIEGDGAAHSSEKDVDRSKVEQTLIGDKRQIQPRRSLQSL